MTAVIIGFSTPRRRNPLSWLIRRLTGSQASHTWFLVQDPLFGIPMVWECGIGGFHPEHAGRFWRDNHILSCARLPVDLSSGLPVTAEWLGNQYDVAGGLGLLVNLLGRRLHLQWRNPVQGPHALFCSEVIVRLLQAAGWAPAAALVPDDTTPQDLIDFLPGAGAFMQTAPATPAAALGGP